MKKADFSRCARSFLHWRGWKATGRFFVELWQAVCRWPVWKKLFALPMWLIGLLFPVCGVLLILVFARGWEENPLAYGLYCLSAYSFAALCVRLPGAVRGVKGWLENYPKIAQKLGDKELRFSLELYFEQFINFAYGIFKTAAGVVIGSAWVGADGIYNLAQAVIQLFQILRRRAPGDKISQWRSYRIAGVLILLMHLTLTGIVFQTVSWRRVEESGEIMAIATAAFAFYKFISSFIDIAKDRAHKQPIDSSVRMLELSQAFFAIFSLQAMLLHLYGGGERWEDMLNALSGCLVCLLTAAMGVYMIRRACREIKKLREDTNGKERVL